MAAFRWRSSSSSAVSVAAAAQALEEVLERRRDEEDEERAGDLLLDDLGALDVDLEDHVAAGRRAPRGPRSRGVPYQLPWTSFASRNSPASRCAANVAAVEEVVVDAVDLAGPHRPRRAGHDVVVFRARAAARRSASMIVSLPTPLGPEMITSIAPLAHVQVLGLGLATRRSPDDLAQAVEDRLELGRERRRRRG